MSGFWNCAFIGEGTSDDSLTSPLEGLVMSLVPGDDVRVEAVRLPRRLRHAPVTEKIAELAEDEGFTLVFVHRDADQAGLRARQEEILRPHGHRHIVPVVPVRETEAWALAQLWGDEAYRVWLSGHWSIGRLRALEEVSDPKAVLRAWAERSASDLEWVRFRSEAISAIDPQGGVAELGAWGQLRGRLIESMIAVRPHLRSVLSP